MFQWIEPEQLPLFGQLLIRAVPYLPVFGLTCLRSVCLVLSETRLSARGGARGSGVCVCWRMGEWGGGQNTLRHKGGVAHAFCAACLVILWHHLSTSKLSSGDVSPHLSCMTVANLPFRVAHLLQRLRLSLFPLM